MNNLEPGGKQVKEQCSIESLLQKLGDKQNSLVSIEQRLDEILVIINGTALKEKECITEMKIDSATAALSNVVNNMANSIECIHTKIDQLRKFI